MAAQAIQFLWGQSQFNSALTLLTELVCYWVLIQTCL